jgi:hypothetical protein
MEGGSMGIRRVILAVAASVLLVMAGCSETKIAMAPMIRPSP